MIGLPIIALVIFIIVAISNYLQLQAAESKLAFSLEQSKSLQRAVDFFFRWRDRHSKAMREEMEPIYNLASFLTQKFPQIANFAQLKGIHPCDSASSVISGQHQIIGELKKRIEINNKRFEDTTEAMRRQRDYQVERSAALQDQFVAYVEFASVVAEYLTLTEEQGKKYTQKRYKRLKVLIDMIKARLEGLNAEGQDLPQRPQVDTVAGQCEAGGPAPLGRVFTKLANISGSPLTH